MTSGIKRIMKFIYTVFVMLANDNKQSFIVSKMQK